MSWDLIFQHLFIVLAASLLSIAVGLPLGIWAYVSKTARPVILRIVDLLQTIPSLALLGIIMVVLDPGKLTVITGITLYSLLPIVRNTCLGLQEVDPGVKEAARGMGMSKPYRVLMVEFPLAFPTVFTGIRIAVVNAIGTAVFAAFVGGGGLGGVITQAIRISDMSLISGGHRRPYGHRRGAGPHHELVRGADAQEPGRLQENVDPGGGHRTGVHPAAALWPRRHRRHSSL